MATIASDSPVTELSEPKEPGVPCADRWRTDHNVNIGVSVPLPAGRWYITVLAGRERRDVGRRREERRKRPLATSGNLVFVLIMGLVVGGGFWLVVQSLLLLILRLING